MKNKDIDVFISFHTETSLSLAQLISEELSQRGFKDWYAKRDLRGGENYTKMIPLAISKSKLMIQLMNIYADDSDEVLRESQTALQFKVPIIVVRLDDCDLRTENKYASSVEQIIDSRGLSQEKIAQQVSEEISYWMENNKCHFEQASEFTFKFGRDYNGLNFYEDIGERERLKLQHKFVYNFAKDVYEDVLSETDDAYFLDVGCNTGEQSMMFLEGKKNIKYIGVDREQEALTKGKELYPDGNFFLMDCESSDFDEELTRIEKELQIDGFDIINISMLILHTKKPLDLLDVLVKHLSENGRVIVLDIDDGFNIAYPDEEGFFQKAVDICAGTAYSGFRHSGRQIYELLFDADLQDIQLKKIGLSTVGMDRKEKEEFYEIYFWFILDDLKKMHEENPNNRVVTSELNWFNENYRSMKTKFKGKGFFFNLGFMIYTAVKD